MSFPTYPNYKDSGVEWLGEVPEHWQALALSRVLAAPVTDGPHTTPEFLDDGIPFLSVDGIQDGKLYFEGCRYVSIEDHKEFSKKAEPKYNDLLMGKAASIGKIARVTENIEFSIWSPLALIRVTEKHCRPEFLEFCLKSSELQHQILLASNSNTQLNIGMKDIPKLRIPLPAVQDQNQIVRFLDHETARIDALIEEQQRLIELLKEKRQAVISQAVTKGLDPTVPMKDSGVEWIGEVPAHWKLTRVGWQCIVGNGCTPARDNLDYWEDGYYPWLNSSKVNLDRVVDADQFVTSKALKECALPIVKPGCVLMAITGEGKTRGMVTITEIEATINQHVAFIEPRRGRLVAAYLHDWLNANYSRIRHDSADWGSTKAAITCADIRTYPLSLPPKEEQEAICQFVGSKSALFNRLMSAAEENVGFLLERRSALISAAVTGKIDVRGWQPPASAKVQELQEETM